MSALEEGGPAPAREPRHRIRLLAALPWRLAGVLAALATAVAGWLLVLAFCTLAWLSDDAGSGYEQVLEFSARAWLLANGVPMQIGGVDVSLVPLGFTGLIAVMVSSLVGAIAHGVGRAVGPGAPGPTRMDRRGSLALRLTGWFAVPYAALLVICTGLLGHQQATGRAILGGLLIGGVFGLPAAGRALHWRLVGLDQEGRASGVVAGVCAALATIVLAGAVLLAVALVRGHTTVLALHQQLAPGLFGGILVALAQPMWIPNAVLWACSWLLGAGFTLGTDSLVSPTSTHLGTLPAFPLFGAVPQPGQAPGGLVWLLVGALAGAVGGAVAVRARRDRTGRALSSTGTGHDLAALVGLVVGVLAGLAIWLLQFAGRGDLGDTLLVGLGARMTTLLVLAPTVMGTGAMVGGHLTAVLSGSARVAGGRQRADG